MVDLHCIVCKLKKSKRNVNVAPPAKISADAHEREACIIRELEREETSHLRACASQRLIDTHFKAETKLENSSWL